MVCNFSEKEMIGRLSCAETSSVTSDKCSCENPVLVMPSEKCLLFDFVMSVCGV